MASVCCVLLPAVTGTVLVQMHVCADIDGCCWRVRANFSVPYQSAGLGPHMAPQVHYFAV
jgi:hypothetical protein